MRHYLPVFLTLVFSSLLLLSSCKDKKATDEKANKPVEVQKTAPKAVAPEPVKKVAPAPPPKPAIKKVVVKEGEWLYDISRREYGTSQGWKKIYDANKALIDNPDLIFPNQELVIPE
jgi:nucleoid-associated protein YgaU